MKNLSIKEREALVKELVGAKVQKFNRGWKVPTFDGVDIINHMERGTKLLRQEGHLGESLWTDTLVDFDEFKYIDKDGYGISDDILLINFNFSQKTEEVKNTKTVKKLRQEIAQLKEDLGINEDNEEAIAELRYELKREDLDKNTKKQLEKELEELLTVEEKSTTKNAKQYDKAKKEYDKLRQQKRRLDKDSKNYEVKVKELEVKINSAKDKMNKYKGDKASGLTKKRIEALNDKEDKLLKLEEKATQGFKEYTENDSKSQQEIREILDRDGIVITTKEDGRAVKKLYKHSEHTSSKGRTGKGQYLLAEVRDAETDELIRKGIWERERKEFGAGLPEIGEAQYKEYCKLIAEGKIEEAEKLSFPLVEYGSYSTLPQSALVFNKNTKGEIEHMPYMMIEPEEILTVMDVDVEIPVDAMVEYVVNEDNMEELAKKTGRKDLKLGEVVEIHEKKYTTKNTMWDGMCVLDNSVFGQREEGFALLRNKNFKSGANRWDVQGEVKKFCKANGLNYEEDYVLDCFGNKRYYRDIKMITTENSTKLYKFMKTKYPNLSKEEALKQIGKDIDEEIRSTNCLFSIVKEPHSSKFGNYQQSSYQQLISLNVADNRENAKAQLEKLLDHEIDTINGMKDNDALFREFLIQTADDNNNNDFIVALMDKNKDICKAQEFRAFKSTMISNYKNDVKSGKVKLQGDNLILSGDTDALINYALDGNRADKYLTKNGKLDLDKYDGLFNGFNDDGYVNIMSKKFAKGEIVTMKRSPHAGDFSIVLAKNCYDPENSELVEKMKGFSNEQVIVDYRHYAFQDMTGGSDVDSDFCFTTNDKIDVEIAKRSWKKTPVPVNAVGKSQNKYLLRPSDVSKKDALIAESKVGYMANVCADAQAQLTHMKINNFPKEQIEEMQKIVYRSKNAMDISIDSAKRLFDLRLFSYTDPEVEKEMNKLNAELDSNIVEIEKVRGEIDRLEELKKADKLSIEKDLTKSKAKTKELEDELAPLKALKDNGEKYDKSEFTRINKELKAETERRSELNAKQKEYNALIKEQKENRKSLMDNKKVLTEQKKELRKKAYVNGEYENLLESEAWIRNKNDKIVHASIFEGQKNVEITEGKKLDDNMSLISEILDKKVKTTRSKKDSTTLRSLILDIDKDLPDVDRRQKKNIMDKYEQLMKDINVLQAKIGNTNIQSEKDELINMINILTSDFVNDISKKNIKPNTMRSILIDMTKTQDLTLTNKLLGSLYKKCQIEAEKNGTENLLISCIKGGDGVLPPSSALIEGSNDVMDIMQLKATQGINNMAKYHDELIESLNKEVETLLYNATKGMTTEERVAFMNGVMTPEERAKFNAQGYEARISRIEYLKDQVDQQCGILRNKLEDEVTQVLKYVCVESYNRFIYTQQKNFDMGFEFGKLNRKHINTIINTPIRGTVYTDRIADNIGVYEEKIKEVLLDQYVTGKSYKQYVNKLSEETDYSKMECARLLRTEVTRTCNQSQMESLKELNIDKYIFVATLDSRTSTVCRDMDNKVFKVSEAEVGVNLPPLHPFCRSTTTAFISQDKMDKMSRRARDPKTGKNVTIGNMSYREWEEKYCK